VQSPVPSPAPAPEPRLVPNSLAPVTVALIAINVLFFALEEYWGGSTRSSTLARMGAVYTGAPEPLGWLSVFSYGYLHIGALHIGMNMLGLWNIGRALEPMLGSARFFVLYTLSAVGGGIAISLSTGPQITAGASGALFGLLGAICALLVRRYRSAFFDEERREIRAVLGRILVPNLLISLIPGVSLLGHLGGLVVGGAFMARTLLQRSPKSRPPAQIRSPMMIAASILLALITISSIGWIWSAYEPWLPAATGPTV